MRTPSFDYLRRELAIILKDYPMVDQPMNNKVALDLNKYARLDKKEIARQLRIAVAAATRR